MEKGLSRESSKIRFAVKFVNYAFTMNLILAVLLEAAVALPTVKSSNPSIRALVVSAEAREQMERYSLKALENGDATNTVRGLVFTPKGGAARPMIVYIPGNGEIGDVARQFRQRAIFERVTSAEFQAKYPCYLLAVSPPEKAKTLWGGMPGFPTPVQRAVREFVMEVARWQTRPKVVDMSRLYLTGFSYGGDGAYALAQHYPKDFAAVAPIASVPPLVGYFCKERPGNWWHLHNEGDYARHNISLSTIDEFGKLVNDAGGDFRLGTYPADGHDAWTAAWKEDALWDWMFSKSLKGPVRRPAKKAAPVPISLAKAVCTASVPGIDPRCGPERVIDGLDATWYESRTPFGRDDWLQVDLKEPVRGRFTIVSGDDKGEKRAKRLYAEVSKDGKRWKRVASFSNKDGTCSFASRDQIRYVRVRSEAVKPQPVCLRRLSVVKEGR